MAVGIGADGSEAFGLHGSGISPRPGAGSTGGGPGSALSAGPRPSCGPVPYTEGHGCCGSTGPPGSGASSHGSGGRSSRAAGEDDSAGVCASGSSDPRDVGAPS